MEKCSAEDKVSQGDGDDPLARASLAAKQAKNLDELRRSLVVTLTLKHKLTVEDAAKAIGRSTSWAYAAREAYLSGKQVANPNAHGGRRNQILTLEEEDAFMDEVCREYRRLERVLWLNFRKEIASLRPQDNFVASAVYVPKVSPLFEGLFVDHRLTREDIQIRLVVRKGLEKKAGRPVSNATVFSLMARVGKRKFTNYHPADWERYAPGIPFLK